MKVMKMLQMSLLIFSVMLTSVFTPIATSAAASVTVYVSDEGDDTTGKGDITEPYATLKKAVDEAVAKAIDASADAATVILQGDLPSTAKQILNTGSVAVTITSDGPQLHSIIREQNYYGSMIQIDGGKVTFDNLIIDGNNYQINSSNAGVPNPVAIQVNSGTVTFRNTELKNHHITGNTSTAVVFTTSNSARTIIEEGTYIHSNTVGGDGSVLGAGTSGFLSMKNGLITENAVVEGSNAVIILIGRNNWPSYAMTGGEIKNNSVSTVAISKLPGASVLAFGGTAYVYDNLNKAGEQGNVKLGNTAARDSAYLTIIEPMQDGSKVGVYADLMPDKTINPIVDVAIGIGDAGNISGFPIGKFESKTHIATADDAKSFISDKSTDAAIEYEAAATSTKAKVILKYQDPVVVDVTDDGDPTTHPAGGTVKFDTVGTPAGNLEDATVTISLVSLYKGYDEVIRSAPIDVAADGSWSHPDWDDPRLNNLPPGDYQWEIRAELNGISDTKIIKFSIIDTQPLKDLVDVVEALQETDYTAASWGELEGKLADAYTVLGQDLSTLTQREVDDALAELQAAYDALQRLPVLESAVIKQTVSEGNKVILTFDQEMEITDLNGFSILVDGTPVTMQTVIFNEDPADAKNVILTLPPGTDVNGKSATITYDGSGSLKGKNGAPAAPFNDRKAEDPFTAALTIITPTSGAKAEVTRPDMNGKAEAGSSVTVAVYDENDSLVTGAGGIAVIDGGGNWTFKPLVDLPDGKYKIQATAIKGSTTAMKEQFFEVSIPVAIRIDQPNGNIVTDSKPVFKGTTDAGATVTVEIKDKDGKIINRPAVQVNDDGSWSFKPDNDLADGTYTFEVTATRDGKSNQVSKTITVSATNYSTLDGLQLNSWNETPIGLSPFFNGSITEYRASVTNSVHSVKVTPTAQDLGAKITVSINSGPEQEVTNGMSSGNLPLNAGVNTIVVKVTDSKGHETEYRLTVTRESDNGENNGGNNGGNGSGGSTPVPQPISTPAPEPAKDNLETTVNGNSGSFATSKQTGDNQTAVLIDANKLTQVLITGTAQQLEVYSPNESNLQVDGLTADTLKQLADKGANLNIGNPLAIYPVPGGKMDLNSISKQLGDAALNDIAVHVNIARSSDALINNAKIEATAGGYELLVTPVDLDLTFTNEGKTIRSGQLNDYASKYIALPEGIDPNRITTGVIINPDGSVFHVPTVVTQIDNCYFALINDLRSSGSYSVIWNPKDFDDVQYHWGRADVNNIAARLSLKGNGDNTFSPSRQVTRSEFAEIIVLGLGLMRQDAPQNIFPDVPASAWYRDAVALADEFGIVRGYDNGHFEGGQQITREQGFAMIARAYRLIQSEEVPNQEQIASTLAPYADEANVAAWAKADVAQLITAGIIQGNGPELLSPKAQMTRAEVAALMARMLKVTDLIDK